MSETVLDASALLALIYGEPGSERVATLARQACMSVVNLSETVAKMIDRGWPQTEAWTSARELVGKVIPFDEAQAQKAAELRTTSRMLGLSLGDRACLALAQSLKLPAVTADQVWKKLRIGVTVEAIR